LNLRTEWLASLAENSKVSGDEEEGEVVDVDPDKAEKATAAADEPEEEASEELAEAASAAVPFEKIVGKWSSDQGENGTVTLTLNDDGTFTWEYSSEKSDPFKMEGQYNLGDGNVLTLTDGDAEDSQMAGTVALPEDGKLNFVLAGGPTGDPGLTFEKG